MPPLPSPLTLTGLWDLRFPSHSGAPERITLPSLRSWTAYSDPGVRFFSGTAVYRKRFVVPSSMMGRGRLVTLDLGRVQVMAQVRVNGKDLGVLWKPPYRVDITKAVRAGPNALEVRATDLWPNRMIGDEALPEDSARNPDGTLQRWPEWLERGLPSPVGRLTFTTWRLWKKDDPLLEAGLLGPVTLRTFFRAHVSPWE